MTKHFLIYGQVQGVGYRRFTQRAGQDLGLKGWVRNLFDGRVEVLADGEVETLDALQKLLKKGPSHALVDRVEVVEKNVIISKSAFVVLEDGEGLL